MTRKEIDNPTGNPYTDTAISVYGRTSNYRTAGYLLLDGTFLDFSGKHDADYRSSQVFSQRALDHRNLFEVVEQHPDLGHSEASQVMRNFMRNANAIRFSGHKHETVASWNFEPTREQLRVLSQMVGFGQTELHVSVMVHDDQKTVEKSFSNRITWEDLKEFHKKAVTGFHGHLHSTLLRMSEKLEEIGDYSAETGECPEFAIALTRVMGWDEDPEEKRFRIGVRTMEPWYPDEDGELEPDSDMIEETFSHVVVIHPDDESIDLDWRGEGALEQWENNFEDTFEYDSNGDIECQETHSFEWEDVSLNELVDRMKKYRSGPPIHYNDVHKWEETLKMHMGLIPIKVSEDVKSDEFGI